MKIEKLALPDTPPSELRFLKNKAMDDGPNYEDSQIDEDINLIVKGKIQEAQKQRIVLPEKTDQQLILERAATAVSSQTHSNSKLYRCYGQLLALMSEYLDFGTPRIQPDERAALTVAIFSIAEILTSKHFDRASTHNAVVALAAAADLAVNGSQAELKTALKASMEE